MPFDYGPVQPVDLSGFDLQPFDAGLEAFERGLNDQAAEAEQQLIDVLEDLRAANAEDHLAGLGDGLEEVAAELNDQAVVPMAGDLEEAERAAAESDQDLVDQFANIPGEAWQEPPQFPDYSDIPPSPPPPGEEPGQFPPEY